MSNITLSICIPTYNRPKRIQSLIEQIISFKSEEIEVVICDNNPSSRKTKDIVKNFNDNRIKYFHNKINLGYDANLLKTIIRASGEFIFTMMDEDDIELETIPWILNTIKKSPNLTYLYGSIGDKRPKYNEGDFEKKISIPLKNFYFEDFLHEMYLKNQFYSHNEILFKFEDKLLKKGSETLREMLFCYPHGSGIVLRKDTIDIIKAKKYIGFLFMQEALIAQALISGDVLCTSKIFAYIGEVQHKSNQPLFKGVKYYHPLQRLLQIKYKIEIIYDITKGLKDKKRVKNELLKNLNLLSFGLN